MDRAKSREMLMSSDDVGIPVAEGIKGDRKSDGSMLVGCGKVGGLNSSTVRLNCAIMRELNAQDNLLARYSLVLI